MVLKIDAPLWNDISDRAARELGVVSNDELSELLPYPRAWWVRPNKGRISYIDDFEDTLNWVQTSGTVTKASDATYVHGGAAAMKLVTGGAEDDEAAAEIYIAPLDESSLYATLGFWADLNAAADATPESCDVLWIVDDMTLAESWTFGLRFLNSLSTVQQRKLQVYNDAAGWTDLTGGAARVRIEYPQMHYFELTVKRVAGVGWQYAQAKMNDQAFDLAGVEGDDGVHVTGEQFIKIRCTTDIAAATTMYVDDLAVVDCLNAVP